MTKAKLRSFGERAVGADTNGDPDVRVFKQAFATIIDMCHQRRTEAKDDEKKRIYSVAITAAQTAQMWACKAVMWRSE